MPLKTDLYYLLIYTVHCLIQTRKIKCYIELFLLEQKFNLNCLILDMCFPFQRLRKKMGLPVVWFFFSVGTWATHSLTLYYNLWSTKYCLLKVYFDELIFSMTILKFIIQSTIWQDFIFKVKQCQGYRNATIFPYTEIEKLKFLDRFMNLSNSELHSSPWLFFPLVSRPHLGTPFWQWSSTAIWEMKSNQNSQVHINFVYLFCVPFHISFLWFRTRHMILSVYISKYCFCWCYLPMGDRKIPSSENTQHIFRMNRVLPIQRICETSCCKTKYCM